MDCLYDLVPNIDVKKLSLKLKFANHLIVGDNKDHEALLMDNLPLGFV